MKAYHFLRADMTSAYGKEMPWVVGEERTFTKRKKIALCVAGYHSSPSWYDALGYAPGPVACVVEVSEPVALDDTKQVSRSRRLVAARNVERELRLWGCECAERALLRERERGREPDVRSWRAIEAARLFANGQVSVEKLDAAWAAAGAAAAAWDPARDAAWAAAGAAAAAWDAARDAARDAAWAAARAAARAAEVAWQRQRLHEMLEG